MASGTLSLLVVQALSEYSGNFLSDLEWFIRRAADKTLALASTHRLEFVIGFVGLLVIWRLAFSGRARG